MELHENFYFLLTPILVLVTYLSAFKNGKPTCDRFITNYFLYLLTSFFISFSSHKMIDKGIITTKKQYKWPLFILLLVLIFLIIKVKNQFLQHVIYLLILLILSYLNKIFLEKLDRKQIESILKKMIIIILVCMAIALKYPKLITNSLLNALIFGLISVLILGFIDHVFFNKKYKSYLDLITVFLFAGFIMYDTNRVVIESKRCKQGGKNPNYIDLVFNMLLNLDGIFKNLAELELA